MFRPLKELQCICTVVCPCYKFFLKYAQKRECFFSWWLLCLLPLAVLQMPFCREVSVAQEVAAERPACNSECWGNLCSVPQGKLGAGSSCWTARWDTSPARLGKRAAWNSATDRCLSQLKSFQLTSHSPLHLSCHWNNILLHSLSCT